MLKRIRICWWTGLSVGSWPCLCGGLLSRFCILSFIWSRGFLDLERRRRRKRMMERKKSRQNRSKCICIMYAGTSTSTNNSTTSRLFVLPILTLNAWEHWNLFATMRTVDCCDDMMHIQGHVQGTRTSHRVVTLHLVITDILLPVCYSSLRRKIIERRWSVRT